MIFELPFDLIVMARTSAIPPAPALYVALFFLPLFAIEVLTLALAATRPGARVTRWTAGWLAGMFGVFTVWALIGFEYPWGGLPLALNIVSKVLAFAVALSVFVRREYVERTTSPR
jgi:apolipoprotein N-acyltransferase